jgi:hypothetical protein
MSYADKNGTGECAKAFPSIKKKGDLVLIVDSNSPRNIWPRGRVVSTTPGRDGRVRIAEISTKGGVLNRPANKLILLMSQSPH